MRTLLVVVLLMAVLVAGCSLPPDKSAWNVLAPDRFEVLYTNGTTDRVTDWEDSFNDTDSEHWTFGLSWDLLPVVVEPDRKLEALQRTVTLLQSLLELQTTAGKERAEALRRLDTP
jgi:hypothetical protein